MAGFTRRHALPHHYYAGFRCARSAATPTTLTSYRFSLYGCPHDAPPVSVMVRGGDGKPIAYALDQFAPALVTRTSDAAGVVDTLPCDGTFVLRPMTAGLVNIDVGDAGGCVSGAHTVDLGAGGDAPARGVYPIVLSVAGGCSQ
jgi:hypothetical protein